MSSTLLSDIRLACRSMHRQPLFTAIVVGTLALGIGAATATFSLVHATLLEPLPYADADRLVMAWRTVPGGRQALNSTPDFYDYREQATSLESLVATQGTALRATILDPAESLMWTRVSCGFLSTMGVRPVAGRTFIMTDGRPDAPRAAVIAERLARRRFGTPQAAVGRTIALAGTGRTDISPVVVGVLPSTYRFMNDADVWLPLRQGENDAPQTRNQHRWVLVGKLKPGVALQAAQQEVDGIAKRLQQLYPASNAAKGLRLEPLQTVLAETRRPRLIVLTGAIGLVLLIACANVAGLLLVRGAGRRAEVAVRAALGATRGRIAAQLLTESAVLATSAGVLGAVLATWLQRFLTVAAGAASEGAPDVVRLPVLLFALVLSVATGLLSGVVPALTAAATCPAADLGPAARVTGSRGSTRLRRALVVGQVAVTVTLVMAAGLQTRSVVRLTGTSLGFEAAHRLTGTVELPRTSPAERLQFYKGLRANLAALPGVTDVGFVSHLPIRDRFDDLPTWTTGRRLADGSRLRSADMRLTLPGYFRTMGIPLVAGRDIGDNDGAGSARVLVINQRMARTLFPGQSPLGRHVTVSSDPSPVDFEIVGVVGDARIDGVELPAPLTMYAPLGQFWETRAAMSFVVRTALAPEALSETVRRLVAARNPNVPAERLVSMDDLVAATLRSRRVMAVTLGAFSGAALLLAVLGLYGVLAFYVAERGREIGVRMALGAGAGLISRLVLSEGALMVGPGLAMGFVASLAAGRLMRPLLYQVEPTDAATYVAAALGLAALAFVASLFPALRAARVNPVQALRGE